MSKFTRGEIFVIKACKSHYTPDAYSDARAIIKNIIYANPKAYFESELKVLKGIILKSREWTVEQWDARVTEAIIKSIETSNFFTTGKLKVETREEFENNLINHYCSQIQSLQVREIIKYSEFGDKVEWIDLINLDTTWQEDIEVQEAIDKG